MINTNNHTLSLGEHVIRKHAGHSPIKIPFLGIGYRTSDEKDDFNSCDCTNRTVSLLFAMSKKFSVAPKANTLDSLPQFDNESLAKIIGLNTVLLRRIETLERDNEGLRKELENLRDADAYITFDENPETNVIKSDLYVYQNGVFQWMWGQRSPMPDRKWPGSGPSEDDEPNHTARVWRNRAEWVLSKVSREYIACPSRCKKPEPEIIEPGQQRSAWKRISAAHTMDEAISNFVEGTLLNEIDSNCSQIKHLGLLIKEKEAIQLDLSEQLINTLTDLEGIKKERREADRAFLNTMKFKLRSSWTGVV
jgi:hypothetical protein